jgi:hypothetical protein
MLTARQAKDQACIHASERYLKDVKEITRDCDQEIRERVAAGEHHLLMSKLGRDAAWETVRTVLESKGYRVATDGAFVSISWD